MVITTRPITEEMLQQLENAGIRYEVVNGELVEVELTGENHGWLEAKLLIALGAHILANQLGRLYPGDTSFILSGEAGDIRIKREPDIAFVKAENVVSTLGYIYRAPDLAIEIISPSQTYKEIREKIKDYFAYGTQEVWIVIPESKVIEVHTLTAAPKTYTTGDTLPGGDLLPGLTLDVTGVFGAEV